MVRASGVRRYLPNFHPDLIEEQQERIVSLALRTAAIGSGQEGVHLRPVQISDHRSSCPFEGHGADLSGPGDVLRTVFRKEAGQGVNGRKTLVASSDGTVTGALKMGQKLPHDLSRHIGDGEPVYIFMEHFGREWQQQAQRISVAEPSIAREVALSYQVFEQEAPHPRPQ